LSRRAKLRGVSYDRCKKYEEGSAERKKCRKKKTRKKGRKENGIKKHRKEETEGLRKN
jgi:hypothetical protein